MLDNAITRANGTWKALGPKEVLMVMPYAENPELSDMALVQACLQEISLYYPRIREFQVGTDHAGEFGYCLTVIVRGV